MTVLNVHQILRTLSATPNALISFSATAPGS